MKRKIFFSIIACMLLLLTVVATTYAWVGIFTYANTGSFDIGIYSERKDFEYWLTISLTGNPGDFGQEADSTGIRKQIIENMGLDSRYTESAEAINSFFAGSKLNSVSCVIDDTTLQPTGWYEADHNQKTYFKTMDTNQYYKFDFYLSVDVKNGITPSTQDFTSSVYLTDLEQTIIGNYGKMDFKPTGHNPFNDIDYDNIESWDYYPSLTNEEKNLLKGTVPTLRNLNYEGFRVKTSDTARFSLSFYEPKPIDYTYTDADLPQKCMLYAGGTYLPTKVVESDGTEYYSLGGTLPSDFNTAIQDEYSINYPYKTPLMDTFTSDRYSLVATPATGTAQTGVDYYSLENGNFFKQVFQPGRNVQGYYTLDITTIPAGTKYSPYITYYTDIMGDYYLTDVSKYQAMVLPEEVYRRGDIYLGDIINNLETSTLSWGKDDAMDGVNDLGYVNGVQTKMKVTVYFWYEGWDADNLRGIGRGATELNISLSSDALIED